MSAIDHGAAVLLVTGAPGAGKSTVTRLVAERLTRSARLDGDMVNRLVVSGRVGPVCEPADEAVRQVRLCNDNLCLLAGSFADAGFTPVLDWVVPDREQLDLYVHALASRRLLLVVLDPGAAVCRARNEARDPEEQFFFDGHDALTAGMREAFGNEGWWFDTADLTAEETVARILAEAPERAEVTR